MLRHPRLYNHHCSFIFQILVTSKPEEGWYGLASRKIFLNIRRCVSLAVVFTYHRFTAKTVSKWRPPNFFRIVVTSEAETSLSGKTEFLLATGENNEKKAFWSSSPRGRGNLHIKGAGMLVRNFELNP